jgi:hypothetical protein
MIGVVSQGGSGEERRVFVFVKAEGQVCRRRWVRWVQRGRGADDIWLERTGLVKMRVVMLMWLIKDVGWGWVVRG